MKSVRQYGKAGVRAAVRAAGKNAAIRRMLQDEFGKTALMNMRLDDAALYCGRWWEEVDSIYTLCRRQLEADRYWRQGPSRVHETTQKQFRALHPYIDFRGKTFLDLGCCRHHPYGTSAIMYLNGAAPLIAFDRASFDKRRATEALADLICRCICFPEKWNWNGCDPEAFAGRIRRFDLEALSNGDLDAGVSGVPIRHVVGNMEDEGVIEVESVDLLVSWDVLEHVVDFETAMHRMFSMMKPGGVAHHCIDLADHRVYWNPSIHKWAFLAEENDFSDSGCSNRLRSCEIRPFFEKAGFKILRYDVRTEPMPEGFHGQLIERFRKMPDSELRIVGIDCVLQKP